jgi:hypothetical protein
MLAIEIVLCHGTRAEIPESRFPRKIGHTIPHFVGDTLNDRLVGLFQFPNGLCLRDRDQSATDVYLEPDFGNEVKA